MEKPEGDDGSNKKEPDKKPKRRIIIETDGDEAGIIANDCGRIETGAILAGLAQSFMTKRP